MELNKEQREAVEYLDGALLVIAGAGSGKTRTIVAKIEYLIRKGFDPKRILAITFTNKAAKELKDRIKNSLGVNLPWVGTFHSVANRILRWGGKFIGINPDFVILDREDARRVLREVLKEFDTEFKDTLYEEAISKYKEGGKFISTDGGFIAIDTLDHFWEIFEAYQKRLKQLNALDFSDLLYFTVKLLKENPPVGKKLRNHFQYILVDEYQDTNEIQYDFIKLIARNHVCVVGDPNQAIYQWRGANPENLLRFKKDFSPKVVKLERNYRSKGVILEIANAVIRNCNPKWASLIPRLKTDKDFGEKPLVRRFESEEEEALWIAKEIKLLKERGYKLKDIAVLVRSSYLTEKIEKAFVKEGIAYTIVGAARFYERKEVKDALAFLRFLHNPADDLAFERILRAFFGRKWERIYKILGRFYKTDWIETLKMVAYHLEEGFREPLTKFLQALVNIKWEEVQTRYAEYLQKLLEDIDYYGLLYRENNPQDRIENVEYFLRLTQSSQSKGRTLTEFLQLVALLQSEMEERGRGVRVMTVHASKGLEFSVVFLPRLEEGIFPHKSAFENEEEMEEERRLFYVAVTRAKEKLYLSYVRKRNSKSGKEIERKPSRFLSEIPKELLDLRFFVKQRVSAKNFAGGGKREKKQGGINKYKKPNLEGKSLRVGQRVKHPVFGKGKVISTQGAFAMVDFGGEVKKIHSHFLEEV
ncbi:MAG TPA: ATP-dependent DNA helicase Rep [Aquifex aeolicus]|uniref:DNA 3'-5' helicase n=1 Tax=Aquifex aeolicus TaxID=63363 RepID=A0A9D0YNK9_AQUAO|nr:ATP-dependent DNA helicase Rep [Aquifex aeolicus]